MWRSFAEWLKGRDPLDLVVGVGGLILTALALLLSWRSSRKQTDIADAQKDFAKRQEERDIERQRIERQNAETAARDAERVAKERARAPDVSMRQLPTRLDRSRETRVYKLAVRNAGTATAHNVQWHLILPTAVLHESDIRVMPGNTKLSDRQYFGDFDDSDERRSELIGTYDEPLLPDTEMACVTVASKERVQRFEWFVVTEEGRFPREGVTPLRPMWQS